MLMTGKEYLQSIRDGRIIYVGKERIEDQTTHPAFAGAARTYARHSVLGWGTVRRPCPL